MATPKSNQLLEEDAEDMNNQYFRVKGDDRLLPLVRLPKAVVHAVLVHGMSPSGMVILIKTFCDVSYPKVLRRGGDLMCITQKQRDGLRKVREKAGHHFEKI